MIKNKQGQDKTVVGLGLSHENLWRLKDGQPVVVRLADLGFEGSPHEVLIFAGETEAAIIDRFEARGLIGPDTERHQ